MNKMKLRANKKGQKISIELTVKEYERRQLQGKITNALDWRLMGCHRIHGSAVTVCHFAANFLA